MSAKPLFQAYHILVQYEYEAKDLQPKIKSFTDFQNYAKKYSTCSSAKDGGSLGVFKPNRFVEAFAEAFEVLPENQVSKPVRTQFGYHLIYKVSVS